jgi:hypothetical protein
VSLNIIKRQAKMIFDNVHLAQDFKIFKTENDIVL